jgi:Gly-Xaa carboxypeptidase
MRRYHQITPLVRTIPEYLNVLLTSEVGYLAQIIQAIEDNPFQSSLSTKNPTAAYLSCAASFAPDIPYDLKDAILNSPSSDTVIRYLDNSRQTRSLVRTSTAVDIVQGGVKSNSNLTSKQLLLLTWSLVNALPESAYIKVNHRVSVDQSIQDVKDHYDQIIFPLTKKWDFTYNGFNNESSLESNLESRQNGSAPGTVSVIALHEMGPSPVSDSNDVRFSWLAGTLRGVFGADVLVAPVLMTGAFNARFYFANF